MNLFVKNLDPETQILIAMASAVAAGCQPCLRQIVTLARDEKLDAAKMRAAVQIGQFVKDQPAAQIKELADALLGSNLCGRPSGSKTVAAEGQPTMSCPCQGQA